MVSAGSAARQTIAGMFSIALVLLRRCRAALEGGSEGITAEAVVLPDGEQHKSTEVLMQVSAHLLKVLFCSQLLVLLASLNYNMHVEGACPASGTALSVIVASTEGAPQAQLLAWQVCFGVQGAACRGMQAA